MARRTIVPMVLLCLLTAGGCVTSAPLGSGLLKKSPASKQPLTRFALKSLLPKEKTAVKIVSPLDWFRGPSSESVAAATLTSRQIAGLTEKYRAAVAENAGRQAASVAGSQLLNSPFANIPNSKAAVASEIPSLGTASLPSPFLPAIPGGRLTATSRSPANPASGHLRSAQRRPASSSNSPLMQSQLPAARPQIAQTAMMQPIATQGAPAIASPMQGWQHQLTASATPTPNSIVPRLTPAQHTTAQFTAAPYTKAQYTTAQYTTAPYAAGPLSANGVRNSPSKDPATKASEFAFSTNYPSTNHRPLPYLSTAVAPPITPIYR